MTTVLRLALALAVAVAVAAAAFLVLRKSRSGDGADEVATAYTLPGYRISLPAWQGKVGTKYWFDALRLDDPTGGGRFIELRWSPNPPEPESTIAVAQQLMQAKIVSREPVDAAGKKGEVVYFETLKAPAQAFAFTPFDCNDGRSAWLLTFLNQAKEPLIAAHRKALATLTCANDPKPPRAYPKVAMPDGLTMTEKTSGRTYAPATNDHRFFFSSGVPGPGFAQDFERNETLRQQVIGAEFGAQRVDLELLRLDAGTVWSGSVAQTDGKTVKVVTKAFHCPGPDESFFAYHVDERATPDEGAADALLTATCP